MIRKVGGGAEDYDLVITVYELSEEEKAERRRVSEARALNEAWAKEHYHELMERALGKYVAVANQEAFIADTRLQASELAEAAHPNDRGIVTRYIRPKGIRIYANRG